MALKEQKSFNNATAAQTHTFRQWSVSQPEGSVPAHIIEGVVVDLNFRLWTVDVISKFDQKTFLNIQIGTPYLHNRSGEGIYVFPDIGAKCHICMPSDSSPPYLLDFIMPQETIEQPDAEDGTSGGDGDKEEASFGGGRVRPKAGDIYIRGRNGNFAILHKGGVLQIGSTELAQRIYIPMQNLITDISQNYRHYNTGGAINWFLAAGDSETNPRTIHRQTFRLMAGDAKASVRVTTGLLKDLVTEGGDSAGKLSSLNIGEDEPVVYEVVLSPELFDADKGSIVSADTSKQSKLRFFFDKGGGAFLRSESSVYLRVGSSLRMDIKGQLEIHTQDSFNISAKNTGRVDGGDLLELQGRVTKINGGSKPTAHVGSVVEIRLIKPLNGVPMTPAGGPVIIPPIDPVTGAPVTISGTIVSGNSTVLV